MSDLHWRECHTFAARMFWARKNLKDPQGGPRLPSKKEAADYLGIKPGTYRTYEEEKGEYGRQPPLLEIQRIARRLRVSWEWLATGEGRPDENVQADDGVRQLNSKIAQLPAGDLRDQAVEAANGVVETFLRRVK